MPAKSRKSSSLSISRHQIQFLSLHCLHAMKRELNFTCSLLLKSCESRDPCRQRPYQRVSLHVFKCSNLSLIPLTACLPACLSACLSVIHSHARLPVCPSLPSRLSCNSTLSSRQARQVKNSITDSSIDFFPKSMSWHLESALSGAEFSLSHGCRIRFQRCQITQICLNKQTVSKRFYSRLLSHSYFWDMFFGAIDLNFQ